MSRFTDLKTELAGAPKRWVVTGVAGFIGSALCEQLLGLGQEVVGLDNFSTGHRHNLDKVRAIVGEEAAARFTFIEGDIRNPEDCAKACDATDYVLHQAALGSVPRSIGDPLSSHDSNVNGFLNMLIAARDAKAKRFVYASSSSVYGDHPDLPKVEANIGKQLSPYAITKRVDELYAGVFQDNYGLQVIGMRYFNVFGRRQDPKGAYAAVIPRWLGALIDGEKCKVFGDGTNSRDFCYVDNVVQANLLAATTQSAEATNQVYNVGCNGNTDLKELYQVIRDAVAMRHPQVADWEAIFTDPRAGDVAHSQADVAKIERLLGYEFTHDITSGMRETAAWYLDELS
ncbi:MAG: NAD-dependent epimerase/dehydratase family protein [Myxococcales bacterium]|nr:NAD-dependent epimerase/dehydratase family protein [Myxococcales bacterium]